MMCRWYFINFNAVEKEDDKEDNDTLNFVILMLVPNVATVVEQL